MATGGPCTHAIRAAAHEKLRDTRQPLALTQTLPRQRGHARICSGNVVSLRCVARRPSLVATARRALRDAAPPPPRYRQAGPPGLGHVMALIAHHQGSAGSVFQPPGQLRDPTKRTADIGKHLQLADCWMSQGRVSIADAECARHRKNHQSQAM